MPEEIFATVLCHAVLVWRGGGVAMELSGYAVAPLREGDVTRWRGFGNGRTPVLLVTAADA